MKNVKFALLGFLVFVIFTIGAFAQELPAQELPVDAIIDASVRGDQPKAAAAPVKALELASISSTASGGLWSSPSTWEGGVVPGAGDNVTIVAGSAVVIDTAAAAGNLTIGTGSLTPAILTFDPGTARSLTVNGDLTIQNSLAMLATPSTGTITNHTVTIGGNLTNNGVLDLSTNDNQAGADLVFTNASSNTFGGGGPVNDVRTITVNKGTTSANNLILSVSNFTVQGSGTDTAASGYLTLTNGTFAIAGTFTGNHRTFSTVNYLVPATAGLWLANANYTVAAQNGKAEFSGPLRISSGTYNIGTAATDSLLMNSPSQAVFEGGTLNVAGSFKANSGGPVFFQSGGTINLCIAGNVAPCFQYIVGTATGGDIYIQNPRAVPDESFPDYAAGLTLMVGGGNHAVHFGNAFTPATAHFTASGALSNVVLDTTTGPHTLKMSGVSANSVGDISIGSGGTLDTGDAYFTMVGNTFVNNGTFKVQSNSSMSLYCGDGTYSGAGSFSGAIKSIFIQCNSLTFDPAGSGIRALSVSLDRTHLINSGKLTIGNNDSQPSALYMVQGASFDSSPTFDLGTGGMKLVYYRTLSHTAGPEIPPSRTLTELTCDECTGPITFTGGDLTVNGALKIGAGVFDMGNNRLIHSTGAVTRTTGYVRGTLVFKFTSAGQFYNFYVGDNHSMQVFVQPTAFTTNPTFVSVRPTDTALPGLPAATTASLSWTMEQSAPMTSVLRLFYGEEDVNGNENSYKIWRNTPPLPLLYSVSQTITSQNWSTVSGLTSLNGTWGIGESIPVISISGRVTASGGNGIANATVMLTGGSLGTPRLIQTGPFGTYAFTGVDPGGEYTVTASAKRNRFGTMERTVSSWTSVANVDFVANPPE